MRPRTFIGAGCVALLLAPALAIGQSSGITAVDTPRPAWQGTPVTVGVGATVTFAYAGAEEHFVEFTSGPTPSCTPGVPMSYTRGPWSGECTFPTAGEYEFVCPVHHTPPNATMRGTIRVAEPTPTPTAAPNPSSTPGASPTPPPVPTVRPQTSLKLTLASGQRGSRVRGKVEVLIAASRLEVTLRARLTRARVRVGRIVRANAGTGAVAFSVPLDAKAKRVLRSRRRLDVTVVVALTPPDGKTITRSRKVRVRG